MSLRASGLLCAILSLPVVAWGTQDAETSTRAVDAELAAKIEKYIGLAQSGRMSVRPQAARRLVSLGAPAAERLFEACGPVGSQMETMGPSLVEVLGAFGDPRLRKFLWRNLQDLDFPWRGAAARGLAGSAIKAEASAYSSLLRDHLAPVRVAAVDGIQRVSQNTPELQEFLVSSLLLDSNDIVRRAIVLLLDEWGNSGYLLWLVEDLKRTDKYFRLPFGEQARYQSSRALKERLGDLYGYDAAAKTGNGPALERMTAAIKERSPGELPKLPANALAGHFTEGDTIGLELRSCRLGEFFLRWNRADILYVGSGNPVSIALAPGSVRELERALTASLEGLGEERYWGTAGCDIEQLRLVDTSGDLANYLISKGQGADPDLRPAALDRAMKLLVAAIPDGTKAQAELREEVEKALRVIGGDY
ncbi:MAG: hypothetical protein ACI8X5_000156 [Planctomycetota bacterium]|jgi:hypothetical protein